MVVLDLNIGVGRDADGLAEPGFGVVNRRMRVLKIVDGLRFEFFRQEDLRLYSETHTVALLDRIQAGTREREVGLGSADTCVCRREHVVGLSTLNIRSWIARSNAKFAAISCSRSPRSDARDRPKSSKS